MTIYINRHAVEVAEGANLQEVLAQQGISATGTAVAIGDRVVPRTEWATTILAEEIKITVIRAVCGG